MNRRRLLWIYLQIAVVSGVSVLVFSRLFDGPQFALAASAVGGVAFVSAVLGGLVAGSVYLFHVFRTVWRDVLALAWP